MRRLLALRRRGLIRTAPQSTKRWSPGEFGSIGDPKLDLGATLYVMGDVEGPEMTAIAGCLVVALLVSSIVSYFLGRSSL